MAAVLVPGLVVGAMATALMSPNDAGPNAWATETTLWLGIAAVLAVTRALRRGSAFCQACCTSMMKNFPSGRAVPG